MRAALYTGNRSIELAAREPVAPGPDEVRIAVAYTGICGTDLHILHGVMDRRVSAPQVIGHEMAGRLAALGDGVTGLEVGQPVTVMPLEWCGDCPACRAGHRHVCHRLNFVGIDSPGSMQESWTVPARLVVPLPADLPLKHGALVEPTAVAVHDVRRARLRGGERAVVVGGGPVGLLIGLVARAEDADVVILEPDPQRRAVATALGLTARTPGLGGWVDDWTGGAGAEVVFEVSGSAAGITEAVGLLAVRGRLVVVGIHSEARAVDLHRFFWRELTMVGARVYERADYDSAIDLIHSGRIPAGALITHVEPLDRAPEAFAALERRGATMKVLLDCGLAAA
jgi:(R,R)-butanediol dehydrogenase / meso-butanediol dehydrogenase / diacetyl reductase